MSLVQTDSQCGAQAGAMGTISEIIVHIGLEKSGTTSIQVFLDNHRDMLRSQGIVCSGCLGWSNHKLLAAYGMDDGSRDIAVTSAGIDSPAAHQAFRERTRGHVLAEIARTDATRYLLTSEDLSRLTSIAEVRRIHALLSPICERIRVIVFLRRQDLLAISRYYSLLVGGDLPSALFPMPDAAAYYDYAAMLDIWADVFGDDAIRIVRYPENRLAEGFDAIGAFCQAADIALPAGWQAQSRQDNVSLDIVSQIILESLNRNGSIMTSKSARKRALELLRVQDGSAHGQLVSATEARAFCERFALGNARLERRFGLTRPLFSADFSMYPQTPVARGDLAQAALGRMAAMVAALLAQPSAPT